MMERRRVRQGMPPTTDSALERLTTLPMPPNQKKNLCAEQVATLPAVIQ